MGSKYASRIVWYVVLGSITISVVWIRAPILTAAFFSTVASYVPASLLWMLLGPFLQRTRPRSTMLFGMQERTLLISVIFGGACLSVLFLFLGKATAASFGIVAMLGGTDGVLLSREARTAGPI